MVNSAAAASYTGWEEVVVSGEDGWREVHYNLKRNDGGGPDLVVVGKEKSPKRMYFYGLRDKKHLLSSLQYSSLLKLRSRREVIDWLNSIAPDVSQRHYSEQFAGYTENKGANRLDVDSIKDVQMHKPKLYPMEFMWLGSPWTCRKRRKHYLSFCRNGVEISVYDFVYVLAEEDKRLVAYLDDMYEDYRGNKMVVVRWLHKIDEVGFDLPHNYNDREVFFSLCLQDLSIECIDGQAIVLSPEHYKNVLKESRTLLSAPFVCYRQFDNDGIKPFDITQVKGYWKQEILKNISSSSPIEKSNYNVKVEGHLSDAVGIGPKKRLRQSKECEIYLQPPEKRKCFDASSKDSIGGRISCSSVSLSWQDPRMITRNQYLTIGSQVEVLSQDSGMRGCWFRALIIKTHKDKVKVQYRDIKDAANGSRNLEEWILASRLAAPDELGVRIHGRTILRPLPLPNNGKLSMVVDIGSIVDAWWHDGWWEGIVVNRKIEDKLLVYFPGEKREMIFGVDDLRQSQEWVENVWKDIKAMPEVLPILSKLERKPHLETSSDGNRNLRPLRWMSYGKRRRGKNPVQKVQDDVTSSGACSAIDTLTSFVNPSSQKVDPDNCKYANDTLFTSSVSSPVTSLVMSR